MGQPSANVLGRYQGFIFKFILCPYKMGRARTPQYTEKNHPIVRVIAKYLLETGHKYLLQSS